MHSTEAIPIKVLDDLVVQAGKYEEDRHAYALAVVRSILESSEPQVRGPVLEAIHEHTNWMKSE